MNWKDWLVISLSATLAIGSGVYVVYQRGRVNEAERQRAVADAALVVVEKQIKAVEAKTARRIRAIKPLAYAAEKRAPTGADANALLAEPLPVGWP